MVKMKNKDSIFIFRRFFHAVGHQVPVTYTMVLPKMESSLYLRRYTGSRFLCVCGLMVTVVDVE